MNLVIVYESVFLKNSPCSKIPGKAKSVTGCSISILNTSRPGQILGHV